MSRTYHTSTMSLYVSAEESNAMMKTMMLQQSCNNVTGDDTDPTGFRLIVDDPKDDECNCQLVRSLGAGRNIRVSVNNNMLMVDVVGDTPVCANRWWLDYCQSSHQY